MMNCVFAVAAVLACAAALDCPMPVDVMLLQDTTNGLDPIIDYMVQQLPLIYAGVSALHPNPLFGLAEFQDKPYVPLGQPGSFCYKLAVPLTDDLSLLGSEYGFFYGSGGGDTPEAQFQAIINAALDPAVGWRTQYDNETSSSENEVVTGGRFIILVTDALPHVAGDMAKFAAFPDVPQGLPENSGIISTDDIAYECLYQDYPSPTQVKDALRSTRTTLIILTPETAAVIPGWTWVNSDLLEQPSAYYQRLNTTSLRFYETIVQLIHEATAQCPTSTSTTTTSTSTTTTLPDQASTSGPTTTVSPECADCPCVPPNPCTMCPPECDAAILLRFAKEPKNLQVIVNNE